MPNDNRQTRTQRVRWDERSKCMAMAREMSGNDWRENQRLRRELAALHQAADEVTTGLDLLYAAVQRVERQATSMALVPMSDDNPDRFVIGWTDADGQRRSTSARGLLSAVVAFKKHTDPASGAR